MLRSLALSLTLLTSGCAPLLLTAGAPTGAGGAAAGRPGDAPLVDSTAEAPVEPEEADDRPLSAEPATCGAAQNHCLRSGVWLVTGYGLTAAYRRAGRWLHWNGEPAEGLAYRSVPVTSADQLRGRLFAVPEHPITSELDAHTVSWMRVNIWEVHGDRVVTSRGEHPIDQVRRIVDTRTIPRPPS